jgi:excisionase family DNA binding protein
MARRSLSSFYTWAAGRRPQTTDRNCSQIRKMAGRGERIRTSDILLPKQHPPASATFAPLAPGPIHSPKSAESLTASVPASQPVAPWPKDFATSLLPTPCGGGVGSEPAGPLIGPKEAARRLGVCKATVYKLCTRGVLTHVRLFNAVRIPQAAIDDLIRRGGGRS